MTASVFAVGTGHESSIPCPTHDEAEGDWLRLAVQWGGGSLTTPTDWTHVATESIAGGTESLSIFIRKAAGTTTPNASLAGPSNHAWGQIQTIRGAHQTKPIRNIAMVTMLNSGTSMFYPGIKVDIDDLLVENIHGWALDGATGISSSEANSQLSSVGENYDAGTITGNGGGLTSISGTLATPPAGGFLKQTTATSTPVGVAATIAWAPEASVSLGTNDVTIAGSPAADGGNAYIYDKTQPHASDLAILDTTSSGAFDGLMVPYDDHEYIVIFNNGTNFGASPASAPPP